MAFKEKQTSALVSDLFNKAELPVPNEVKQRWEDLEVIYQANADSLFDIALQIRNCTDLIRRVPCSNQQEVIQTINGVVRDLDIFTNQLVDLHKLHEGKTGIINDPDELALCISIFNQYSGFNDRFRAVIFPVVITITEAYSEAEAIVKQNEASDVDVITDLEIISETKKVQ
jgi:hypothetical protein